VFQQGLWNALIYFRPRYKKLDEEMGALRKVASLINATLFFWVSRSGTNNYLSDSKDVVDFADVCPPGLVEAETRMKTLIKTLRIKSQDLILGGFSQGAMLTCRIALTLTDDIAAMLLFSGNCINLQVWSENAARHQKIPFIQSHGQEDPVLGFKHAEKLYKMLTQAGLQGEFIPFKGFHEIPLPVIQQAAKFLQKIG